MKTKFLCNYCQKTLYRNPGEINKNKSGLFYCNQSCAAKINNKTNQKRFKEGNCKTCKKPITAQDTYCNICYKDKFHLTGKTLNDAINRRKQDTNRYAGIRGNARKIYYGSNQPKCCKNCGYNKHVEICHIKAIADFPLDTLVSTINAIENLMALCPNCHWEHDAGLLKVGHTGFEPITSLL